MNNGILRDGGAGVNGSDDDDEHFRSDVGYADAFVRQHGGACRFIVEEKCWLTFTDAGGWHRDDGGEVRALFAEYARELYRDAARKAQKLPMDRSAEAAKILTTAAALGNRKRIDPALAFVAVNPEVTIRAEQLDADPLLLGVRNGVVNLRDATFGPHQINRYVTRRCAAGFDEAATCPHWLRFIEEVQPDVVMQRFLQRLAGYCLTGSLSEHYLPFHYGVGANGKGTMLEQVLLKLLGDYGAKLTHQLLYDDRHAPHLEIAGLCGKRLALGDESADGGALNERLLKSMTGGDRQKGRYHYANFVEYFPSAKINLVGNHKPRIAGRDYGFWRRFILIDWPVAIPPERRDSDLPRRLADELPGILNWCVAGCIDWQREGVNPPASCLAATEVFREESDPLAEFVNDHLVRKEGVTCAKAAVFAAYQAWADGQGIPKNRQFPKRTLTFRLSERGFNEARTGKDRSRDWLDVALEADA